MTNGDGKWSTIFKVYKHQGEGRIICSAMRSLTGRNGIILKRGKGSLDNGKTFLLAKSGSAVEFVLNSWSAGPWDI